MKSKQLKFQFVKLTTGACFLFLLFSLVQVIAQIATKSTEVRPVVESIVKAIEKGNSLDAKYIGEGAYISPQWKRFEKLQSKANNVELRSLTKYPNAVVRCYAFHAMALRNDMAVFSVLLNHLRDTARVSTMSGDLGSSEMAGDYFIEVVTPNDVDLESYKLKLNQKIILDSCLLYDKNINLAAKSFLLAQLKPKPENYERIKEIVKTEFNPMALLALARYRKQSDLSIISAYLDKPGVLYYAVYSVREFPDPSLYPKLVQIFETEWKRKAYDYPLWRILYQALAQYPVKQTLELFERTVQSKDKFQCQTLGTYLTIALTKYPNLLFNKVQGEIKLDAIQKEEIIGQLQSEK